MTTDDDYDELFDRHARSFGAVADLYDRGRPTYPLEAAQWMLPANAAFVADVGAGTGKFTRVLKEVVYEVVAVEPDAEMRAQLQRSLPTVPSLDGTGESLPFEDSALDAVTFAQAWHWVDPEHGSAEAARVLRPGGALGLVWNIRDESVPWVARLSEIIARPESHYLAAGDPVVRPPFGPLEHREFRWTAEQTREEFLAMITSRSYISTMPDDERAVLVGEVEHLLDTDPALREDETVHVPYITQAHRAICP